MKYYPAGDRSTGHRSEEPFTQHGEVVPAVSASLRECHQPFIAAAMDWIETPSFAAYVPSLPLSLGMPILPPLW